jgi:hypothetical protein
MDRMKGYALLRINTHHETMVEPIGIEPMTS